MNAWTLANLPLAIRVVFTSYLLTLGVGLMMAGAQIMMTHGMADGKIGLSVDDVVYSYYGNKEGTKIEGKLNGSMKVMAPDEVRLDIIKWVRDGADQAQWEPKFQGVFAQYCVPCHNAEQTALPNFTIYENVHKVAEVDEGASFSSLTRISHIHLFGISFIFMFVGLIFALAKFNTFWKLVLIITPFAFLVIDVFSWWLTKLHPGFAWFTIIGGFGYTLASTIMILTSLMQMWLPKYKN
jgi:hypothetical protein